MLFFELAAVRHEFDEMILITTDAVRVSTLDASDLLIENRLSIPIMSPPVGERDFLSKSRFRNYLFYSRNSEPMCRSAATRLATFRTLSWFNLC